jgi:glycoprotein 2-beta-D-xylosyltransferase
MERGDDSVISADFKYQSLRYSAKFHRHQTSSSDAGNELEPSDASHQDFEKSVRSLPSASDSVISRKRLATAHGVSFSNSTGHRHKFARKTEDPAPQWSRTVYYDLSSPPPIFDSWTKSTTKLCWSDGSGSQFVMYSKLFADLRNVVIDLRKCLSNRLGGEAVNDVIGQEEATEYYVVNRGCFRLACSTSKEKEWSTEQYIFEGNSHLNSWLHDGVAFKKWNTDSFDDVDKVIDSFTIAVQRYEYVNLYHTMTDWYNAFIMMQYFQRTADETVILIVDTHPHGSLDDVWNRLFGRVVRMSGIGRRRPVLFRHLVWSIVGYESPMKIRATVPAPPLYDEFRNHFLTSYNFDVTKVDSPTSIKCSSLSVLFIWRRNYVAHPRNPSGQVSEICWALCIWISFYCFVRMRTACGKEFM